ncbi:MAG: Cytochrome oxidase maturation protein cbb3-type [Bacteroidota bacterium]|jgi:cbb3-type cytochrome oxidase maturation protein
MLIAFSLGLALMFLWLFLRAVKSGQYDDGITPAMRMLFEEDTPTESRHRRGTGSR